jgi:ketosteroid isomerase-like protein
MPVRPSEVIRAYYATFTGRGLEAAAELWDSDIEWRSFEAHEGGVVRGADAMRRYYAEWVDTMDELGADVCEVVFEDDERVVVQVRNFGRGRVSGVPVTGSYYVAALVRGGRILSGREFAARDEALRAAEALGTRDG